MGLRPNSAAPPARSSAGETRCSPAIALFSHRLPIDIGADAPEEFLLTHSDMEPEIIGARKAVNTDGQIRNGRTATAQTASTRNSRIQARRIAALAAVSLPAIDIPCVTELQLDTLVLGGCLVEGVDDRCPNDGNGNQTYSDQRLRWQGCTSPCE